MTLYEKLGGRATLERVHKTFYDYLYREPKFKKFFANTEQSLIESIQTKFMAAKFGGPQEYLGYGVKEAHINMLITQELLELRQKYLEQAIKDNQVPDELLIEWLKIDHAFWSQIVKHSISDCSRRYRTQELISS